MNHLIAHLGDPLVLSHVGSDCHLEWHDGVRVSVGHRGGRYEARARGVGGSARLRRPEPPTDWQMRNLCAVAGLLPDPQELAAAEAAIQ